MPVKKRRGVLCVDFHFIHRDGRDERIRKTSPVQTIRGAMEYENQLRNELREIDEKPLRKEVPVFSDFAEEFMRVYVEVNNKPAEVNKKRSILDHHLLPFFGPKRLNEIGAQDIERFKSQAIAKFKPKTINNLTGCLRKILATAQEWEIIDRLPRIRKLKSPAPSFDFLDFAESERLLKGAEGQWRVMILTALRTGMRHGEMLALRWSDVDLIAGRLMVNQSVWNGIVGTPKSGKSREIPISDDLRLALQKYKHLRGEYVFCQPDGSMLTRHECRRPLRWACKKAGLREVGWHCLRHTFASQMTMKGVPLKTVQELLGHSTIMMTERYSHLSPDCRREAINVLCPKMTDISGHKLVTNGCS